MVEYSCLWMPVLGCLEKSLVEVIDPHSVKTCFFTIKKMWITSWLPILQVEMNLTRCVFFNLCIKLSLIFLISVNYSLHSKIMFVVAID